jgi:hypothetical protein
MNLSRRGSISKLRRIRAKARKFYAERKPISNNLGIDGSTFRAFRGLKTSPSKLYKAWVEKHGIRKINGLTRPYTRNSFEDLHRNLIRSIEKFWKMKANRPLTIAEKFKVVDLFIKAISRSNSITRPINNFLVQYGHIPLDKYSLNAVKKLFYGIVVCNEPRMGNIEDEETYTFIQSQIYLLTSKSKVPNLYFEFYAVSVNMFL